jgi:tRNA(Ile)-lysidine synthase
VSCALSGGADSTALVLLALAAGCEVTAHHVDHGLRASSSSDALIASTIAAELGIDIVVHQVQVAPGPNLEARARAARFAALPNDVMTGHTADDQVETVLLRLLRGAGADGLSAMDAGYRHPILALRRGETRAVCAEHGIVTAEDPTNDDPAHRRNRVRHEVIPMLDEVAGRDVVPLLVRTSDLLRDDARLIDELAADIDPTDAVGLASAHVALARRAVRRWLTVDGYPPDAASVERVLEVARGHRVACEVEGGRRVARTNQRLRVTPPER